MLAEWLRQLRAWFSGSRFDAELEEEMRFHRDMHEQKLREAGLSQQEAKRQAGIAFGSALAVREESRESWGFAWVDSLGQDLRYGLRQLNRNRGFAATAILTIALGVGASAAIFTLVNAVLLRPLPYPEPDRVVVLNQDLHADHRLARTPDLDLHYIKDKFRSFSGIGSRARGGEHWKTAHGVEDLDAVMVDSELLNLLGFQPLMGRTFTLQDDLSRANVVILSHEFWQMRLGGKPDVVGETIVLTDEPFTIIGVARPEFRLDWEYPQAAQIYTPISRLDSTRSTRASIDGDMSRG